ncbi:MAG: hypothetical protein V2I33_23815 [Kangiellaceae bacterium]|jgi:hypothetical protein|nr:hypothetical protein [Kangiellaceae bacterium]
MSKIGLAIVLLVSFTVVFAKKPTCTNRKLATSHYVGDLDDFDSPRFNKEITLKQGECVAIEERCSPHRRYLWKLEENSSSDKLELENPLIQEQLEFSRDTLLEPDKCVFEFKAIPNAATGDVILKFELAKSPNNTQPAPRALTPHWIKIKIIEGDS